MKQSTDCILTSHVGRLQRPDALTDLLVARQAGEPVDPAVLSPLLSASVADVVRQQNDAGISVVNDGEFGRISWFVYAFERLTGFEMKPTPLELNRAVLRGKDQLDFAEYYSEFTGQAGLTYYRSPGASGAGGGLPNLAWACTGPIAYKGQEAVATEIANLKAALAKTGAKEGFLTATAPADIVFASQNLHYPNEEARIEATAEAMRTEYKAITDAGLILQIDDPMIPAAWDLMLAGQANLGDYYRYCEPRIEALNHALAGIPEDRIRYHICWGSHHGPHSTDIPLRDVLPLLFKVHARGILYEAANARHEHEFQVWKDVKLPEGKILIPGIVGHSTTTVEHPDLVAWRIRLLADIVGRENVIAGTDCGLGYRVHPQIAWAKLTALAEGAALASKALW